MELEINNSERKEKSGRNEITNQDANIKIQVRSVLIFLVATLATGILLEFLPSKSSLWTPISLLAPGKFKSKNASFTVRAPTFAIYSKGSTEEHLKHVLNALTHSGYERTSIDDEWELLWAHDYPFILMSKKMKALQPHQMVNHFPGCGFITNKVDLSTTRLPFLPRAFRLPEQHTEFLTYAHDHPDALFVEKHNEHRHISIKAITQFNFSSDNNFIQEFVRNPFLVDGYKFDIGVYVVITSIDPLRIYIYTGDVLFRYCTVKYYPFNSSIIDKYVVGDDYLPTWEVPSLKSYYNEFGGSMRSAFEAYVRDMDLDPSVIWPQVEDIITQTIYAKESHIASVLQSYKTRKFFELIRFDLIIDDKLKVILMEANMSPNLSSAHFKPNALLYEHILYSVLNLVGVTSPMKQLSTEFSSTKDEIINLDPGIAMDLNKCSKFNCHRACNIRECKLCLPCLSGTELDILKKAHREHLHRTDMRRIFPKPIINVEHYNVEIKVQNMTKRNEWMVRWFYGKCQYDRSWCY